MSALIDVVAFKAANSRAYLKAVFDAWQDGLVTTALPDRVGDAIPGTRILRHQSFDPDPGWMETALPVRPETDHALIAFSSGTTGVPKAILLSHRALNDVVSRINAAMQTNETVREYLGVPVTFSFGFGRVRAVAEAGGAAYLPPNGFDPGEIGRMLAQGDINAVSAVPTLWRVLLANPDTISSKAALNLRWIEIGSQLMTGAEKLALRQMFPNARIVQHYGMTEASRSSLLDISEAPEERLDSVGRATGTTEIEIDDQGRIRVRGPHLAEGLLTADGITPITDADGWLTTSDQGALDDGWLSYKGRIDELINVGGIKVDPTAFEQALNKTIGQAGALAAGKVSDPLRGEKILIAVPREAKLERTDIESKARQLVADYGITGSGAFEVRQVAEIPTTATGKVQRAALADLPAEPFATEPEHPEPIQPPDTDSHQINELRALWSDILGVDTVDVDKSFYDLGGDSLSALTAVLRMETLGIDTEIARGIFDGKTILDLAQPETQPAHAPPEKGLRLTEAINAVHATRGALVFWVILIHWLPWAMARLGDTNFEVYRMLTPAWRFGTPGFAIVFGIGIGTLRMHHYLSNRDLFLKNIRLNAMLVVAGVLILGLINFANVAMEGRLGDTRATSGIFYSVITYYALALILLPLILRLLSIGSNRLLSILMMAAVCFITHEVLANWYGYLRPENPLVEFVKLIGTAKYGFFRMTGYVMIGVAIGWIYRKHHDTSNLVAHTAGFGVVMILFGLNGLYVANPEDWNNSFNAPAIWHLSIYAGAALLILAGFSWLNKNGGPSRGSVQKANAFMIATGILALPLFVTHEMVSAMKRLTDNLGLPEGPSLALLMLTFLVGMGFVYWRLMRFFWR